MSLPSTRSYFIRALHEWCCDHGFTPYITVVADEWARVPREFVRDGHIVLNIDYEATNRLNIGNEEISFQARFGGVPRDILIPVGNVVAIYARENGHGMAFEYEKSSPAQNDAQETDQKMSLCGCDWLWHSSLPFWPRRVRRSALRFSLSGMSPNRVLMLLRQRIS